MPCSCHWQFNVGSDAVSFSVSTHLSLKTPTVLTTPETLSHVYIKYWWQIAGVRNDREATAAVCWIHKSEHIVLFVLLFHWCSVIGARCTIWHSFHEHLPQRQFSLKSLASCSFDLQRLGRPRTVGITPTFNAFWTMETHEYLKQGNGRGWSLALEFTIRKSKLDIRSRWLQCIRVVNLRG